jgi:DNA-binding transcriptional MocR family regulator
MSRDQDEALLGCVFDGMEAGIDLAIDCLVEAQPKVSTENQTWNTAIAVLRLYSAKAKDRRPDSKKVLDESTRGAS